MDYQNHQDAINTRTAAYNLGLQSGNMDSYKAAAYNVRREVKDAKGDYGKKVQLKFQEGNPRSMWQGLRTMTGYKPTHPSLSSADVSLASD